MKMTLRRPLTCLRLVSRENIEDEVDPTLRRVDCHPRNRVCLRATYNYIYYNQVNSRVSLYAKVLN